VSILTGAGAACGLSFGDLFGVSMAIVMRPGAVTIPVGDRDEFLSRLDAEMAKLRYRPLGRYDGGCGSTGRGCSSGRMPSTSNSGSAPGRRR
jgi:hypothetical protein